MKIAIYAPIALWEVHLAQAIEIAHINHSEGKEVHVIHCKGSLSSCAANMFHEEIKCGECRLQTRASIYRQFPKSTFHHDLDRVRLPKVLIQKIQEIDSLDALKGFAYDNHLFGLSVFTSLVTQNRDWNLDFQQIRESAIDLLINSIEHYLAMRSLLQEGFDEFFVFGGRRASEALGAFAALSNGIPVSYFEHGSKAGRYWITKNKVFTWEGIKNEISNWKSEFWNTQVHSKEREALGEEFFSNLRSSKIKDPYFRSYLSDYHEELVIETSRPLMAVFTSSLWEFAGYDELLECPEDFLDQYALYETIGSDKEIQAKYQIVFRWHPHLKRAGKDEVKRIEEVILNTKGCLHIKPDDPINSYHVMEIADLIVTVGSTMGIESAASGKPSILLGKSSYSGIGAVYEPLDYKQFKQLVKTVPKALPKEKALLYGDWASNYGEEFRFIRREDTKYYIGRKRIKKRSVSYRLKRWIFRGREKLSHKFSKI
jgi:hypothetical protein